MNFTQEQMSEIFDEIASKKDGYRHLLKLSLESIMKAEHYQCAVLEGMSLIFSNLKLKDNLKFKDSTSILYK